MLGMRAQSNNKPLKTMPRSSPAALFLQVCVNKVSPQDNLRVTRVARQRRHKMPLQCHKIKGHIFYPRVAPQRSKSQAEQPPHSPV